MPGTAGLFELFGYDEEQFFLVGTADQLDVDREAFGRAAHGQREGGEAGEIEPLAVTHGIPVVVWLTGGVVAFAVLKRRLGRHGRDEDGRALQLPKNGGAYQIAIFASLLERSQRDGRIELCGLQVGLEHWTQLGFLALCHLAEQIRYCGSEEKPPEIESLLEVAEF